MRQYLSEKRINYFRGKKDNHPKKGWINWWEDFYTTIGRNVMKQKIKRDINANNP